MWTDFSGHTLILLVLSWGGSDVLWWWMMTMLYILTFLSLHASCSYGCFVVCKARSCLDVVLSIPWMSRHMTKPTRWLMRQVKTRISLCIRSVWSGSLLSARSIIGSLAILEVHGEDWSDWADAQTDLNLHWAHRSFCWFCHAAAREHWALLQENLCFVVSTR